MEKRVRWIRGWNRRNQCNLIKNGMNDVIGRLV